MLCNRQGKITAFHTEVTKATWNTSISTQDMKLTENTEKRKTPFGFSPWPMWPFHLQFVFHCDILSSYKSTSRRILELGRPCPAILHGQNTPWPYQDPSSSMWLQPHITHRWGPLLPPTQGPGRKGRCFTHTFTTAENKCDFKVRIKYAVSHEPLERVIMLEELPC